MYVRACKKSMRGILSENFKTFLWKKKKKNCGERVNGRKDHLDVKIQKALTKAFFNKRSRYQLLKRSAKRHYSWAPFGCVASWYHAPGVWSITSCHWCCVHRKGTLLHFPHSMQLSMSTWQKAVKSFASIIHLTGSPQCSPESWEDAGGHILNVGIQTRNSSLFLLFYSLETAQAHYTWASHKSKRRVMRRVYDWLWVTLAS